MNEAVKVLFHELADLPAPQRDKLYAQRAVPAAIRAEVESLLSFSASYTGFLRDGVAVAAEALLSSCTGPRENTLCGPYRLLRVLGRGGMGVVYLAERADGEVEQRVAIKFLQPGGNPPSSRERFLRERQILAALNHPGIARLIDAGHTRDEQPYLVMEYIEGIPIDVYAAQLDPRAVLALFLPVLDAVSYAHRNLVIHRDLKPSNILIQAGGQPKLLDFGIARMLDQAEATRTVERLLTPDYASPEQLRGQARATTTDIYSLGAILYRLLTGRTPHNGAEAGGTGAAREIAPPSRVIPDLARDLDCIVLKALRGEPEERYDSADAFSTDIRAFLEDRPVQARKGNSWYRGRKFLRRYWLPAAAAALALSGLSIGLYVANRERAVAQRRFQQVRQLSNELLALDADIRRLPGATKARHRLVSTSLRYLERLGPEAENDTDLALEIGSGYLWVARAQGVLIDNNLGQTAEAEQSLRVADQFVESVLRANPLNKTAILRSAEVAHDRMILAQGAHRRADALAYGRAAAGRLETLLKLKGVAVEEVSRAATLYSNMALAHQNLHQLEDAVRYARRCVELARPLDQARTQYSFGSSVLATSLRYLGDLNGALDAVREARRAMEESEDDDARFNLISVLWREGVILGEDDGISLNRPREAAAVLRRAFDLAEEFARKDQSDYSSRARLAMAGRELGDILRHSDARSALEAYDLARHRLGEIKNNPKARRDEVWLLAGSSYALRSMRRFDQAGERIDRAFATLREIKEYPAERIEPGEQVAAAIRALGDHQAGTGRVAEALGTYQGLLEKVLAAKPQPEANLRHANSLSKIYQRLSELARRNGRKDLASAMAKRRFELWNHWNRKLPENSFILRQMAAAPPQ